MSKSIRFSFVYKTLFALGMAVVAGLALQASIIPVHAQQTLAYPICDFINGTANQPNASVLQYSVGWNKTIVTSNANCVINDPTHYPRTNGINAGATNEIPTPTAKNFLCGWGQSWLYPSPVAGVPWNYGTYNLNNQLYCFQNLHMGRVDVVSVRDMNGNTLNSTQHIQVGQTIMVRLDPLVSGTGVTADQQGPYINLPQDSYQNNWPVTNTTNSALVHCPGVGAAPACSGVDTNSSLSWQTSFPFYQTNMSATTPSGVPANGGAGDQNLLSINPGPGWSAQGIVDLGNCCSAPSTALDSYGYLFKATVTGNLTLSINDVGGVSPGVYGGAFGTGYVIPASGYSGVYGSYTTTDYGVYFSTKGVAYNSVPVTSISIPVDQPVNQPPNTPTVSCVIGSAVNGQNVPVAFQATDPDPGDQLRYDVDPDYNGSSFNPSVSVPASGFVAGGAWQNINLQWATGGVKQVAVRAQDNHFATSALGTCSITVTYVPPPANPNMQFATDPGATTFTDNVVNYNFPQDAWGASGTGVTVPAQYVSNASYQSCVLLPYPPNGVRGTSPYGNTKSSWDSWPVIPSVTSYAPIPAANTLQIKGVSASAPAIGTVLDEYFSFGCGSNIQTAQGQFSGSPDIQEIRLTIVAPQPPTAQVALQVTDTGKVGGSYVNAPQSSPYVFSENLPNSGAYTTNAKLQLKWQTSNVANCTFTRTDGASSGTFNSSQNWNGGTTASLFNSNDQGSMQFTGAQAIQTATIGYTLTCTGSYGTASSTAYVVYQRDLIVLSPPTIAGTVFNDLGGGLGVQDAGEPGIANQVITLVVNNYIGGPYTTTATTDSNGKYSFSFSMSNQMLATGLMTISQTTALPGGWVFTAPLSGVYSNYSVSPAPGAPFGYVLNFAERSQAAAFSTFTGEVFNDSNGDGALTAGEKGVAGQTIQLSRITKYSDGSTTTDQLESGVTNATGIYSLSSFVPPPPNGSISVVYNVTETALPGPGWQYTIPWNGVGSFTAAPNTIYHQDFGNIAPLTIRGVAYNDVSGSGVSAGQTRISGVTIQVFDITSNTLAKMYNLLTGSVIPVTSVNTAVDGSYSIALDATSNGHLIQVRETNRSASYPYCTNPGEGAAPAPDNNLYCEYAPELAGPYTGANGVVILTRDFGNSSTLNSAVTVVSGRVYENKDGVSGFNPAFDNPLAGVTVEIVDTAGNILGTAASTDATGYYSYSIAKFSSAYNALLGKKIIIKELTPSGYTAVSPVGGVYPSTQFNGAGLVNYDFVDTLGGGGGGGTPPDLSIFCSLD